MRPWPFGQGKIKTLLKRQLEEFGFNEALAFRPRKARQGAKHKLMTLASMRPWPFGQGKLVAGSNHLQPTSGFNEALAFRPRKAIRIGGAVDGAGGASMRPWPFGQGKLWTRGA